MISSNVRMGDYNEMIDYSNRAMQLDSNDAEMIKTKIERSSHEYLKAYKQFIFSNSPVALKKIVLNCRHKDLDEDLKNEKMKFLREQASKMDGNGFGQFRRAFGSDILAYLSHADDLGLFLEEGIEGLRKYMFGDYEEAIAILGKPEFQENMFVLYILGLCYRNINQFIEAEKCLLKASNLGHIDSSYDLAKAYMLDKNFPHDLAKAETLFKKVINSNTKDYGTVAEAQFYLAKYFWYNHEELMMNAALNGHELARYHVGMKKICNGSKSGYALLQGCFGIYSRNINLYFNTYTKIMKESFDHENPKHQFLMAQMHSQFPYPDKIGRSMGWAMVHGNATLLPLKITPKEWFKGIKLQKRFWLEKAFERGNAAAKILLCFDIVREDKERAKHLLVEAANQNDVRAMYEYGMMLYEGDSQFGFEINKELGLTFLKKAADVGYQNAKIKLAVIKSISFSRKVRGKKKAVKVQEAPKAPLMIQRAVLSRFQQIDLGSRVEQRQGICAFLERRTLREQAANSVEDQAAHLPQSRRAALTPEQMAKLMKLTA